MSTAVLISGQMRSFDRCLPTQNWHVFRKLDDPYFFVSCVDDEQASSAYLIEGLYPDRVFVEQIAQPVLNIPGTKTVASDNVGQSQRHHFALHAPYAVSASLLAILRQLWHLERVWQFAAGTMAEKGLSAQTYIRIRPDLWFHEVVEDMHDGLTDRKAFLPWWSRCGGCNDRFAMMGPEAAAHYFGTFSKVQKLLASGCPLHPESLLAASLEEGEVDVCNTLLATFRTLRLDGTTVSPVIYPGEQEALVAAMR